MEEDTPAQGGKLAARPSKESVVMFHVSEGDGGLPEQQNASPGGYPSSTQASTKALGGQPGNY